MLPMLIRRHWQSILTLRCNRALTHYRLGIADLQLMPPDAPGGYWELSRAIALKVPGDAPGAGLSAQSASPLSATGLRQIGGRRNQSDGDAGDSARSRPETLTIPSADDLKKAQEDTRISYPGCRKAETTGRRCGWRRAVWSIPMWRCG